MERVDDDWEVAGGSDRDGFFEIEPGVNVWDYAWSGLGKLQLGKSATGPFTYLNLYQIVAEGRRIEFAVAVGSWDSYTFYRHAK